ncbi:hypothetical protein Ciccas_003621 [Cichlidogyrus casuarinus]|uniref:Uncharacterized protein n=1 Tax=Cichlidogyrus casuarinus TaxID=1844966 RepID=A0ABD2QEB5_9PLAT
MLLLWKDEPCALQKSLAHQVEQQLHASIAFPANHPNVTNFLQLIVIMVSAPAAIHVPDFVTQIASSSMTQSTYNVLLANFAIQGISAQKPSTRSGRLSLATFVEMCKNLWAP